MVILVLALCSCLLSVTQPLSTLWARAVPQLWIPFVPLSCHIYTAVLYREACFNLPVAVRSGVQDIGLSNTVFWGVCLRPGLADMADPTETVKPYLVRGPAVLVSTGGR